MSQIQLTDRFCQSAKAPSGQQIDYFDSVIKGLCLRLSPGGTKTFYLYYTRPSLGKRARLKLGRYPSMKLGTARGTASELRVAIDAGHDPIAERQAKDAAQTAGDLVENYIARHAAQKRSGDRIARRLRVNVKEVIGDVRLSDLHRRDLTRCIDLVKDRGAHVEANRVFEDLRAMIRWARARGDLDDNLVEGMRRPTETAPRDRVLTAEEISTVWDGLKSAEMREATRRIIRLCLVTAQRVGEVSGITRGELNLDERVWTLPAERTKNAREHVVPLSELALDIIREQLASTEALSERKRRAVPEFVFPGPGSRASVTAGAVARAIKREEEDRLVMGAVPWTPHDLRRTAATHMEEIGVSPFVIGHVLNHVSVTRASVTSRIYARYNYASEKRQALDLWADRLAGILDRSAPVVSLIKSGS